MQRGVSFASAIARRWGGAPGMLVTSFGLSGKPLFVDMDAVDLSQNQMCRRL